MRHGCLPLLLVPLLGLILVHDSLSELCVKSGGRCMGTHSTRRVEIEAFLGALDDTFVAIVN